MADVSDIALVPRGLGPQAGMLSSMQRSSPFGEIERRPRRLSETDRNSGSTTRPNFRLPLDSKLDSASLTGSSATNKQSLILPGMNPCSAPDSDSIESHECTSKNCSVARVFQMPELLEIVFGFLEYQDILALRRVNHRCNSVIRGSEKLSLQFLFTEGQYRRPRETFELVPLHLPGLEIRRGKEVRLGQWIEVVMTAEVAKLIYPRDPARRVRARSIHEGLRGGLGKRTGRDLWPLKNPDDGDEQFTRYCSTLVSQPPIESVQAFILDEDVASSSAGGNPASGLQPRAKLHCERGITLGHLAEITQQLGPRDNRFADNYKTHYAVLFKAIMSFSDTNSKPRSQRNDAIQTNFLAHYE